MQISQKDNFEANFGEVLRSSAIFWVKNDQTVKTTVSFSNYWKYKNSTDVTVIANTRDIKGRLLHRKRISFDETEVCNYSPPEDFEGSIEIEVFALKNLRIPYAAIMAVYECRDSISMVHSYARAYSQYEIEEGRVICDGQESCWTLRDNRVLSSFGVFHNGGHAMAAQDVRLGVRNSRGEEKCIDFQMAALAPYETVMVEPRTYFPDIEAFLGGEPGNARLSFKLCDGFTRMLCGIRMNDWSQVQVTHSNFDYSVHVTDKVAGKNVAAYMYTPALLDTHRSEEVVVYPDSDPGQYTIAAEGARRTFKTTDIVVEKFEDNLGRRLEFARADDVLPSRIVTALRVNSKSGAIPAECSLGVVHQAVTKKSTAWMLVSDAFRSTISWTDTPEVFGGVPADAELAWSLYSPNRKEPFLRQMRFGDLPKRGVVSLRELFPEASNLENGFGYLVVRSSYGGLNFFSSLEKQDSFSIEHSF